MSESRVTMTCTLCGATCIGSVLESIAWDTTHKHFCPGSKS